MTEKCRDEARKSSWPVLEGVDRHVRFEALSVWFVWTLRFWVASYATTHVPEKGISEESEWVKMASKWSWS